MSIPGSEGPKGIARLKSIPFAIGMIDRTARTPFRCPFGWITLPFAAGVAVAYLVPLPSWLTGVLLFVGWIPGVWLAGRYPPLKAGLLLMVFFLAGMARFAIWRDVQLINAIPGPLPSSLLTVHGTVAEVFTPGDHRSARLIVAVHALSRDSVTMATAFRMLLYLPAGAADNLYAGNRIQVEHLQLDSLPLPRNPGQFNYRRYLYLRGVVCQGKIDSASQIRVYPPETAWERWRYGFSWLRLQSARQFQRYFPRPSAEFLKALILGKREGLDPEVRRDFQLAGLMHVLAISGLHVGFVMGLFSVALSFLPFSYRSRYILLMGLLLGYMLLTGSLPPVVRATLMAVLYLLAILQERSREPFNILMAAAFIILLAAPQQLFWVGFQFSFLAVAGILFAWHRWYPRYMDLRNRWGKSAWKRRLLDGLVVPLGVTVAAQIGTLPLMVLYFQQISLASFLLNLLVVPYIGLLVGLGFLFLPVSFLSPDFAAWMAGFTDELVRGLWYGVHQVVQWPGAYVILPEFTSWRLGVLLLLYLAAYQAFVQQKFRRGVIAGALMILVCLVPRDAGTRFLELVAVDVGQGDALLVRTPSGKVILWDTGPLRRIEQLEFSLLPVFSKLGVRRIHHLIISHPHWDHMGAAFRLMETIPVDTLYLARLPFAHRRQDSLVRHAQRLQVPVRWKAAGQRIVVDAETRLYVLSPFPEEWQTTFSGRGNLNNHSLVVLFNHRGHRVLFPGDAEKEAERILMLWGPLLRAEVLKVPHHGSATSTTPGFLQSVQPELAIISAGRRNRFGHPSAGVINRLRRHNIQTWRTDVDRAVWLRLTAAGWEQVRWRRPVRFVRVPLYGQPRKIFLKQTGNPGKTAPKHQRE